MIDPGMHRAALNDDIARLQMHTSPLSSSRAHSPASTIPQSTVSVGA
jgi:hypothetical protein